MKTLQEMLLSIHNNYGCGARVNMHKSLEHFDMQVARDALCKSTALLALGRLIGITEGLFSVNRVEPVYANRHHAAVTIASNDWVYIYDNVCGANGKEPHSYCDMDGDFYYTPDGRLGICLPDGEHITAGYMPTDIVDYLGYTNDFKVVCTRVDEDGEFTIFSGNKDDCLRRFNEMTVAELKASQYDTVRVCGSKVIASISVNPNF